MRLSVPRLLLRQQQGETEADLQARLVQTAAEGLADNEALVLDAGFSLAHVRRQKHLSFVVRMAQIFDPLYHQPWVLATNLTISTEAVWRLYRDRWPIEQLLLTAKQVLGAARSFVSGQEARYRLPELALLAGNLLSYVAVTTPAIPTGFWDRRSRPTCGRLRRYLATLNFSKLPLPEGRERQLRKKASVTDHSLKGVLAHRRQKTSERASKMPTAA